MEYALPRQTMPSGNTGAESAVRINPVPQCEN